MRRRTSGPRRARATTPALSLAIPCYNEEAILRTTVLRLVNAFGAARIPLELVLVENGSSDGTSREIDRLIRDGLPVIKRVVPVNKGFGLGVRTGLAACRAPLIGYTSADSPVDTEEVVKVYAAASRSTPHTLVKVCRRYRMDGRFRRFTSWCYRWLASLLYWNLDVEDINGMPKIFRREALAPLRLTANGSAFDLELLLNARKLDMDILELSVFDRRRERGGSKVRPGTVLEMATNLLRLRFRRG
jgi:glycosyltransferase involved in cell wall biosynthesis